MAFPESDTFPEDVCQSPIFLDFGEDTIDIVPFVQAHPAFVIGSVRTFFREMYDVKSRVIV